MERKEIIEMARQAGIDHHKLWNDDGTNNLETFAKLVEERTAAKEADRIADEAKHIIKRAEERGAAKEREACAQIGDNFHDDEANCGDLIRARGEQHE